MLSMTQCCNTLRMLMLLSIPDKPDFMAENIMEEPSTIHDQV